MALLSSGRLVVVGVAAIGLLGCADRPLPLPSSALPDLASPAPMPPVDLLVTAHDAAMPPLDASTPVDLHATTDAAPADLSAVRDLGIDAARAPVLSWQPALDGSNANLQGVWGSSGSDVWAVGYARFCTAPAARSRGRWSRPRRRSSASARGAPPPRTSGWPRSAARSTAAVPPSTRGRAKTFRSSPCTARGAPLRPTSGRWATRPRLFTASRTRSVGSRWRATIWAP